jgi:ATP-dependent RNA helicase DOB1
MPSSLTDKKCEMLVLPVSLNQIAEFSALRIYVPDDLKPKSARNSTKETLREVQRRFKDTTATAATTEAAKTTENPFDNAYAPAKINLPLLDPVKDMNIQNEEFLASLKKKKQMEEQLLTNPIHNNPMLPVWMKNYTDKMQVADQMTKVKKEIRATEGMREMRDRIKRMKRVLRRLGFTDKNNVVQLKGRVACEVNAGAQGKSQPQLKETPVQQCILYSVLTTFCLLLLVVFIPLSLANVC